MAADRFYDEQGLHDIQILSTYGLTDDDVMALRRIDGVDVVQPDRTQSATTDVGGTDKSVTMTEIGIAGLDQPYLQEGRMPAKAGEVAVTEKFLIDSGHDIGDTITITPADTTTSFGVDLSESGDSDGNAIQTGADANDSGDSDEQRETAADDANDSGDSDANGERADDETSPQFPTELTITAQVLDPKDLTNPTGYVTSALRSPTTADYVFFAPSSGVTGNVYMTTTASLMRSSTASNTPCRTIGSKPAAKASSTRPNGNSMTPKPTPTPSSTTPSARSTTNAPPWTKTAKPWLTTAASSKPRKPR